MNYKKYQRIKLHKEIAKVVTGDIERNDKTYKRKDIIRKLVDIKSRRLNGT